MHVQDQKKKKKSNFTSAGLFSDDGTEDPAKRFWKARQERLLFALQMERTANTERIGRKNSEKSKKKKRWLFRRGGGSSVLQALKKLRRTEGCVVTMREQKQKCRTERPLTQRKTAQIAPFTFLTCQYSIDSSFCENRHPYDWI